MNASSYQFAAFSAAIIGSYPPRRCGIASFTYDLGKSLERRNLRCLAVAMSDAPGRYDYAPGAVFEELVEEDRDAYAAIANRLNDAGIRALSLQHEFGIFGGRAGAYILELLRLVQAPVITTLHTVLANPDSDQRRVMDGLIARSHRLVVMAQKGREILADSYGVPSGKIALVPHGIPDEPLMESSLAKANLGASGRQLLLTFGLLSPNKGIEVMIDALPAIIRAHPEALYLVVGETHPGLARHEGERYRDSLRERSRIVGVENHIRFIDRFMELPSLLEYIAASDVYVTPYLHEAQITSGTLAYAFGLGRPVVSSPYWHAKELLSDGRGLLVPFGDAEGFAHAINRLLDDAALRSRLQARSRSAGRAMRWSAVAGRYRALFEECGREPMLCDSPRASGLHRLASVSGGGVPALALD